MNGMNRVRVVVENDDGMVDGLRVVWLRVCEVSIHIWCEDLPVFGKCQVLR